MLFVHLTLTGLAKPADLGCQCQNYFVWGRERQEESKTDHAGATQVEMMLMVVLAQVKVSSPPGHGGKGAMSWPEGPSGGIPMPSPSLTCTAGQPRLLGEGSPLLLSPSGTASLGYSWQRLASPPFFHD